MRQIKNYIPFVIKSILIFILSIQLNPILAQNFTSAGYLKKTDLDIGLRSDPVFADIDNDDDLDLYVGDSGGKIKVFINDGNSNFSLVGNLKSDGTDISTMADASPVFADLDKDGALDLYVNDHYNGYIEVYKNDGNGNFTSVGNLQANGVDIELGYNHKLIPEFADLDGDNDLDLYVGHYYGTIRFYRNEGDGEFVSAGYLQADGSNIDIGDYATPNFADIDGDNDLDLYVGEYDGIINVFTNDGSGNLTSVGYLQSNSSNIDVGNNSIPVFADVDKDNDLDLYIGEYDGVVNVYLNDGEGNFTFNGYIQAGSSLINENKNSIPVFANIDNDAIYNLYVGRNDGTINVFTNDGNDNFSLADKLQADNANIDIGNYSVPVFTNIDGDNDLDLYVGEYDGYINIFTNTGSGNFTSIGYLQADGTDINIGTYSKPTFADIDADNDLDLYVGEGDGTINVFINNGDGTFTSAGKLQSEGSNIDVGAESAPIFNDFDSDNDLDLIVGEQDGLINVFTNDGNGNFISAGSLSNIDVYCSVPFFIKLSGDCFQSLLIGGYQGKIYIYTETENSVPIITSTHEDVIVSNEGNCSATLTDYSSTVTATDNCDDNLEITQNPTAGTTITGSSNQVILTVTDDCGNYSEVSFNVSVEDNSNPTITCVENQTVNADDLNGYMVVGIEFDPSYVTDNCEIDSVVNDFNDSSSLESAVLPEGTTNITWTVIDKAGNKETCSFDVIVNTYVGIETLQDKGISIYPNPSSKIINIDFTKNNIKKLTILDIIGKKIFEKTDVKLHEEINISNFNSGVYIVSIQTDKELLTSKIIKK